MALQSALFRGDSKLEAAAVSDSAHIVQGAVGDHVRKVQLALIQLDGATITADGIYGRATAAAVLAYKQKRNIVNYSYQTQADNVVGKMTIAALDAEMLAAETDNGGTPRIVVVYPPPNLSYRRPSAPRFRPAAGQVSERGAKTLTERAPQVILPGQPLQDMELLPNRFGRFQVIDGKGAIVRCWDDSIGWVFDPAESLAHGGSVRVSSNSQWFSVLARSVGETFIEAKKSGQSLNLGGMLRLVVVAASTKLMWKPQWTPKISDRMRCNPWAFKGFPGLEVPGVMLKAPLMEFTGTVDPDSTVPRDDFEVGLLQACIASTLTATYVDAGGTPTWTWTINMQPPPCRDTADDSPLWYHKDAVKPLNAAGDTKVESNDSPQMVAPWQTKDKKGTLVSTSGADHYFTWLAARQKSTGTLTVLCWAHWVVDWGCTFDFKTEQRTLTGTGTFQGQGDDGQGALAPITGGKTALQQTTVTWTGPAGGY